MGWGLRPAGLPGPARGRPAGPKASPPEPSLPAAHGKHQACAGRCYLQKPGLGMSFRHALALRATPRPTPSSPRSLVPGPGSCGLQNGGVGTAAHWLPDALGRERGEVGQPRRSDCFTAQGKIYIKSETHDPPRSTCKEMRASFWAVQGPSGHASGASLAILGAEHEFLEGKQGE